MKTQFGSMYTGDFGNNTMTFKIEGKMVLAAGKYAIMPIKEHKDKFDIVALGGVTKRYCAHGKLSSGNSFTYAEDAINMGVFVNYVNVAYPSFEIEMVELLSV